MGVAAACWVLDRMAPHATTPDTRPSMLTSSEVMQLLRITRATLCRYCRNGLIPHIRMPDQSYRFHSDAIDAWLTQRTAGS